MLLNICAQLAHTFVGIDAMDQTLNMLGMTSVFVGGFTALMLDNMISGTTCFKRCVLVLNLALIIMDVHM